MILIPLLISPIEMLLQIIINKYLSESYCLTVISETPLNLQFPMSSAYLDPTNTKWTTFVDMMLTLSEAGCSDYIVSMEDPQQFIVALEEVGRRGMMRRSDKKLIILPVFDDGNISNILNILTIKECSFYTHLLLILPNISAQLECKTFDLITHRFIGPDNESQLPVKLDTWNSCNNEFENNASVFPHDLKNLNGKTMTIATFIYKPYILLDLDTSIAPLGRDGIEIRMIEEFCRWINCTVKVKREDIELWGQIYENKTGVGVIGSVFEGRCDIGIAALYSWFDEWEAMDFSEAVVRSAVTCLAPSPRPLASWNIPLLPFTSNIWIAVVITFILTCIGLIIAQRCSSRNVWLTVFGTMIAQSQYLGDASWRIRSVIGWLLVSSFILVSAYGAGLASTFTVPKFEPSIDTVKDLVDSRLEWGANHEAWIFSLILSSEPVAKELIKQFRVYTFEELKKLSFSRNMAFTLETLPAGSFAIGDYLTKEAVQEMQLMSEYLYFGQCVAMLHKNSPYTEKLNQLIRWLHQSGLLLAWESQVALKYLDYKIQLAVTQSHTSHDLGETAPLKLQRVEGIFMIYIAGTVLSTIVFALEILSKYIRRSSSRRSFKR